jgi:hypothetical protein
MDGATNCIDRACDILESFSVCEDVSLSLVYRKSKGDFVVSVDGRVPIS